MSRACAGVMPQSRARRLPGTTNLLSDVGLSRARGDAAAQGSQPLYPVLLANLARRLRYTETRYFFRREPQQVRTALGAFVGTGHILAIWLQKGPGAAARRAERIAPVSPLSRRARPRAFAVERTLARPHTRRRVDRRVIEDRRRRAAHDWRRAARLQTPCLPRCPIIGRSGAE
jgi:hypothetical protein